MKEPKTTKIGRLYNELRAQGLRGEDLYDRIKKEFPDIPATSIRSYGTRYRRLHPAQLQQSFSFIPRQKVEIEIDPKLLAAVRQVALERHFSLNELVEQALMSLILDNTLKKSTPDTK